MHSLVQASAGLWCAVTKQELALLGEQFLCAVQRADARGPSEALRILADLLDVAEAALGTVGILDDWMPLEGALDAADVAYRALGEALDDRVVRLTDRLGPAAPSAHRAVLQSR
ncbi:MAG: hypothetical protein KTR31_40325 [Myxococcales bacterium]|nr:hypothetical protein [Myxococcales bacterium]